MDLEILKTITDVDCTEAIWVKSVEELVTRPLKRADHDLIAALIKLKGPSALGLIIRNGLKEARVEGSSREVQLSALCFILYISEMKIIVKAKSIGVCEAAEGFISPDLMLWSHLEGANRANLAVILNGSNNCCQTIQFSKGPQRYFNLFLWRIITVFSRLFLTTTLTLIFWNLLFNFFIVCCLTRENGGRCSHEVIRVNINLSVMLSCETWHFLENEFTGKSPVESLDREFVHVAELESHGDVVVVLDAFNFAPKDQLVSLNACL